MTTTIIITVPNVIIRRLEQVPGAQGLSAAAEKRIMFLDCGVGFFLVSCVGAPQDTPPCTTVGEERL